MNLSKALRSLPRFVSQVPKRGFGGGGGGHGHSAPPQNEITQADLDKYEYLFPGPTKKESTYSLHNMMGMLPFTKSKGFLEFMATNFSTVHTNSTTEHFTPPKVHENSVFIYQSKDLANAVRGLRATEIVVAGFVGFAMHQPIFFFPVAAVWYLAWGRAFFYELSNRLVTRMDLLPHLEMIQIQKTGPFGTVYSKLIRTNDLEKVDYETVEKKENMFWGANKTNVDPHMIFKVKSTGEILCFDKQGFWDWEGLSHELLN